MGFLPAILQLLTPFRSRLKPIYGTDGRTDYVTRLSTTVNA